VRSDGGLMSLDSARATPVHTVLSGPAGGVQGAAYVASRAGLDRILTFDMGGTSTDVATCVGGAPSITRETAVGEFPVRAPSVESPRPQPQAWSTSSPRTCWARCES